MFNKIVWATDGSEAADRCLPVVESLTADSTEPVLVVHCEERTLPGKGGGSFPVNANEAVLLAKIQAQVGQLSKPEAPATLEQRRVWVGGAAQAIDEVAENRGADLIVLGTRGHTPLGGLLLGSVTQRLLHIAHCPVLTVPADAAGRD